MSRLNDVLNAYFIEMVRDKVAKQSLKERLDMTAEQRTEKLLPNTNNLKDAFYVVLGCRFQDSPVQSLLITIAFTVMVGLLAANFITYLMH